MTLSVAESVEEVGRAAWTALVEAAGVSVFSSYDFLCSMERHPLSRPSRAFYLLAHDSRGGLVAGLPLYVQQTRDPFAADPGAAPARALLGHVWHCYDTALPSRVPLGPGLVGQFWATLRELADEVGAERWGLVNVPLRGRLAEQLAAVGVGAEETAPRYQLRLSGGPTSLDEHLAGVGRSSRRVLRQYSRRAARSGAVITLLDGRAGLDQGVLDLCLVTADKHAPGYYPPDEMTALVHRLGPACAVLRVELDGELLAASVCLYDRTRVHTWAGGCRYRDDLNWSPQYVLFAAELELGFASGRQLLECGRRNDDFKRRYGLQPWPLGRAVEGREGVG